MPEAGIVRQRYDFVYLFDCQDGNPNGDPDLAGAPRFDPETMQGLVSDVCLKRKIRNYVHLVKSASGAVEPGYRIFVMPGRSLESQQRLPYEDLKMKSGDRQPDKIAAARAWMCRNFYDVRAFGAVMSTTAFNCGQVRGPIQLTFARSLDPIFSTDHSITRVAFAKEDRAKGAKGNSELGRKHTVAYGLYLAHGFVNAPLAAQTGFQEADLALLWSALEGMFEHDRSAARGLMCARGLYVFRHDSALGDASADKLFERVSVVGKPGIAAARCFEDYSVRASEKDLPKGVRCSD
jgi:CRISPR-associated protein Csd2